MNQTLVVTRVWHPSRSVGYAQSELDNEGGSVIVTPQFLGLGDNGKIDLQGIQCNDDAEDLVSLNLLDNLGIVLQTYYWSTDDAGKLCWLDDDMERADGISFDPGQAFWVQSDEAGNVFQSSGRVSSSDVTIELDDNGGSTMCGNCYPVSVSLQDILCNDDAEDLVSLNILDNLGIVLRTYYWSTDDAGDLCWLDDDMERAEDVSFAPGQALWIQSDEAGNTITFPGVEL